MRDVARSWLLAGAVSVIAGSVVALAGCAQGPTAEEVLSGKVAAAAQADALTAMVSQSADDLTAVDGMELLGREEFVSCSSDSGHLRCSAAMSRLRAVTGEYETWSKAISGRMKDVGCTTLTQPDGVAPGSGTPVSGGSYRCDQQNLDVTVTWTSSSGMDTNGYAAMMAPQGARIVQPVDADALSRRSGDYEWVAVIAVGRIFYDA